MSWKWLEAIPYSWRFIRRVLSRALILFVLINIVYVIVQPLPFLSEISLYNSLLPGRDRFPYSDDSSQTYSVTLPTLEAMFASHILDGEPKSDDEYRVFLVGDSSVWGWLLDSNQTMSACINDLDLTINDRRVRAYNLGYPALSTTKDTIIIEHAQQYEPDAIFWLVTMQALFDIEQLRHPITQTNAQHVRDFADEYVIDYAADALLQDNLFDRTLFAQRRQLADLLRHQVYGLGWWLTGEDHAVVEYIGAPQLNLPQSEAILNRPDLDVGTLPEGVLRWDVLEAGMTAAGRHGAKAVLVNQPIYISDGLNSDLRYNQYYPRWAYESYRSTLSMLADESTWRYVDLWDDVPANRFTDTPFHYDAESTCEVAEKIVQSLIDGAAAN